MKNLRNLTTLLLLGIFIYSCGTSPIKNTDGTKEKPVVVANDSLEYEIIIVDPGFNAYLAGIAFPPGHYSQNYLEIRNRLFVTNWNIRAQNPTRYNANIFWNVIDYQPTIDYGYDVNYKLFNYFLFAQNKYKINLNGVGRPNQVR